MHENPDKSALSNLTSVYGVQGVDLQTLSELTGMHVLVIINNKINSNNFRKVLASSAGMREEAVV